MPAFMGSATLEPMVTTLMLSTPAATTRSALPVDGDAGHRFGQPSREPGVPGDIEALRADLRDAAHDHVVYRARVNPGPVDQGSQGVGGQVDGVDPGQAAVPLADGGAYRADYERIRHHGLRFGDKSCPHRTSYRTGEPNAILSVWVRTTAG
jgi:hypothetical protein